MVPLPDVRGREKILAIHSKALPLADDVDLSVIAKGTPGFTGADLASMINEGALLAARMDKDVVTMADLEAAKDKVMMGSERRSMVISDDEKRTTAYHEAGHALVAAMLPKADPIHKVTIIPRGSALGLTQQLPIEEKYTRNKSDLLDNIAILMGGRAAEEVALDQVTTGAGNDIERATELARKMVCEWGMSEMGPLTFGKKQGQIFLGREFAQHQDFSEQTAQDIDSEVRRIVIGGYKNACDIIRANIAALHDLSSALLERETISGDEVRRVVQSYLTGPPATPVPA
jgi:cell division protease FtsH